MESYHANITLTSLITCICIPLIISSCNSRKSGYGEESNEVIDPRIATIDSLIQAGYEIWDLHSHLKGGLTMDQLLAYSNEAGINYGVPWMPQIHPMCTNRKHLMRTSFP